MIRMLNIISKVFITTVLILSLVATGILFGPLALGYKEYKIVSSSMSPVLNPGDIILIKPINPETLQTGDIITFRTPNSNIIITHRIHRIDEQNQLIYTIGDQNTQEDPQPVMFSNVIGKYINIKMNLFF